jgi:hypothetical protein
MAKAFRPDETHGRPIKPGKEGLLSIPSGFPGQLGLLAQQMNSGFGGGLLNQRSYLDNIYSPMQMQQNQGDDAKTADPTVTTGTDGTGGFELDPGMKKWQRLLYAMPGGQSQLQELQEAFQKMGYLK